MEDICEWPTGLAISIVPHEDSWKVVIMTDGPQDVARCDMIQSIADRLRSQFDLVSAELRRRAANLATLLEKGGEEAIACSPSCSCNG